jgi:uncharacterized protein
MSLEPDLIEAPVILVGESAGEMDGSSGQCDACPPLVPIRMDAQDGGRPASYRAASFAHLADLDGRHVVVCSPQFAGARVLNRSALDFVRCFTSPAGMNDLPGRFLRSWGADRVAETAGRLHALGILQPGAAPVPVVKEAPSDLTAWLHVTDRCNLRCSYCFAPHHARDMALETGQASVRAVLRSARVHGFRRVKLKYAGGEPLLRLGFVEHLHRYARREAEQAGLELDGLVLSNGVLLDEAAVTRLKTLGLRLSVSLDGLGAFHDAQRMTASDGATFESVAGGIACAVQYGLVPNISITVTGRNAAGLAELVDWVLARGLPFSINFYRENACSAGQADLQLDEQRVMRGLRAALKVIEQHIVQGGALPPLLASLLDRANLAAPHRRTCGVGHSYLVFDTQGALHKCQMAMQHALGNAWQPDPLLVVIEDRQVLPNSAVDERLECADCAWRAWCTGGCPLEARSPEGRSPNCAIYRALLPEVLRLEGLRLLAAEPGLTI